jgi:hypothetical protein
MASIRQSPEIESRQEKELRNSYLKNALASAHPIFVEQFLTANRSVS